MKRHPKFHLKLENESTLSNLLDIKMSRVGLAALITFFIAVMFLLAGVVIMVSPLKTLLPGYMKQSERSATEESILRLDSIQSVYSATQAYLANIMRAIDTDRVPDDSVRQADEIREFSSDSLLPAFPQEKKFVSAMAERERFNISVLAPLAAEGMMFSPISDTGIFTSASKTDNLGKVIMAPDEPVRSIADGSVLAAYYSPKDSGYIILIQHSKGFVSRYEGVGNPISSAGDMVLSGQAIALTPPPDGKGHRITGVRIWHNGVPLIPYEYIGTNNTSFVADATYEAPRGR